MVRRKRILFVDDEPRIISGVCRMMRSVRAEWETFGTSVSPEALDIVARDDIDVIVSDMRMPGMMGCDLLEAVRKRHPRTIRLALSGQASKVDVDTCVGLAHRFLSKPCPAQTLKEALDRARILVGMPLGDGLKGILGSLQALPSEPGAYERLQHVVQAKGPTVQAVTDAVSHDVGMSLRILQLLSSSFYAARIGVMSPARQVEFLGVNVLRRLAGLPAAFCRCSRPEGRHVSLARQCHHAGTVADFARRIAQTENAPQGAADDVYAAGLLHDVGKVVWITQLPEAYDAALALVKERRIDPLEAEYQTLEAMHTLAGAYLIGLWGLPDAVMEAAAFHHTPLDATDAGLIPTVMVHAADVLAHELAGAAEGMDPPELDEAALREAGLAHRVPAWRAACLQHVEREMEHEQETFVRR